MSEKKDKVYVPAVRCFAPHDNAPSFVLGSVVIDINGLFTWLKGDGAQYITEYGDNKTKQLKLTALQSDKTGLNFVVDTYKKTEAAPQGKIPPNVKTSQAAKTPNDQNLF